MEGKFVAYYRVSTDKQGKSGLGLEAQKEAVEAYLNGGNWTVLKKFTEIETGKGSNALEKRPELQKALALAKKEKATLLIGKLDRLARNVHFVSGLLETGVAFICVDMPDADKTMLQMMSVFAEFEARKISQRTKEALRVKKAQLEAEGKRLGNPTPNFAAMNRPRSEKADANAEKIRDLLTTWQNNGMSQRAMADELNRLGLTTTRGQEWKQGQVQRALKRLNLV
jgi:DNA invertase Pin-like site-specific DNA recombinase